MIKHFLFVWGAYWVSVLFLPVEGIYPSSIYAFILQFLFVIFVLVGYSWFLVASNAARPPMWGRYQLKHLRSMIRIAIWLSIIGTICLVYDKIFIQGIDYSKGIAVAREAWRKEGESRQGGISSVFSVLGYLLGSGYYVAAVLLVLGGQALDTKSRYKAVFSVFVLLMISSYLAGGRSNVLLLAVFVVGTTVSVTGWSYKYIFKNRFLRIFIFLLLIFSFLYLLYVFAERAEATGIKASSYLRGFLPYLGLKLSPWFEERLGSGVISDITSLFLLAASYITHSFSTTAAIIEHGPGEKIIIFLHPMNILHKLNLVVKPDSSWFLAGRFPSLPGALFYQYGAYGFSVLSLLLGFLGGMAKYFYICRPASVISLSLFLMMYAILILSPLLLAVDFMSFPFVLWSFFLISFLSKAFFAFRITFRP
jgi:hypothetical protein